MDGRSRTYTPSFSTAAMPARHPVQRVLLRQKYCSSLPERGIIGPISSLLNSSLARGGGFRRYQVQKRTVRSTCAKFMPSPFSGRGPFKSGDVGAMSPNTTERRLDVVNGSFATFCRVRVRSL